MDYRLLREDVEVLYGVIQDDTCHSDASQGISHSDSGVGEVLGLYILFYFIELIGLIPCFILMMSV